MHQNPTLPSGAQPASTPAPPQPVDPRRLAEALAEIRADSQHQPETYLRDTVVPSGGE